MICIIDCGTSWLEEIKEQVGSLNISYRVLKLDDIEDMGFELFSGIIISGAPTLLTKSNLQKYVDIFAFVKDSDMPILGICLGHQIIGLLYGTKIHIGEMIDKQEHIHFLNTSDLFQNIEDLSLFREEHSEFIDVPGDFDLLATSYSCVNESMKHKNKQIYGVQFHPEVSGENGKKLFYNFLQMCRLK